MAIIHYNTRYKKLVGSSVSPILKLRIYYDDLIQWGDPTLPYHLPLNSFEFDTYFRVLIKPLAKIVSPTKIEHTVLHTLTREKYVGGTKIDTDKFTLDLSDLSISTLRMLVDYIMLGEERNTFDWVAPLQDLIIEKELKSNKMSNDFKANRKPPKFKELVKKRAGEITQDMLSDENDVGPPPVKFDYARLKARKEEINEQIKKESERILQPRRTASIPKVYGASGQSQPYYTNTLLEFEKEMRRHPTAYYMVKDPLPPTGPESYHAAFFNTATTAVGTTLWSQEIIAEPKTKPME
jgi:hypothetical protein